MTERYGYYLTHKCSSMLRLSFVGIFKIENLGLKYINLILKSTTPTLFNHNYVLNVYKIFFFYFK